MPVGRFLPASPRRRRRLAWTGWSIVVVTAIVAAVVLMPRGERVPQSALRTTPADTAPAAPPLRLTAARRREADTLVRRFAVEAAARRDPAAAWEDASTTMRSAAARGAWNEGNLPVVPFDGEALKEISWRVVYREPGRVGLDVLLVARPGAKQRTTVYAVDLVLEQSRLVVDAWAPRASFAGPAPPSKAETTAAPAEPPPNRGTLDSRWLLIPTGVLALALLVPLGFLARNAIRNRRAYRRYARDGR